mmetsp:Transcript_45167/g.107474  ORF Transcript_45167/g.107474 Transcript_45167/m.107474 type:complete len:215 (+) Transcript_45167:488-1132(+)
MHNPKLHHSEQRPLRRCPYQPAYALWRTQELSSSAELQPKQHPCRIVTARKQTAALLRFSPLLLAKRPYHLEGLEMQIAWLNHCKQQLLKRSPCPPVSPLGETLEPGRSGPQPLRQFVCRPETSVQQTSRCTHRCWQQPKQPRHHSATVVRHASGLVHSTKLPASRFLYHHAMLQKRTVRLPHGVQQLAEPRLYHCANTKGHPSERENYARLLS